MSAIDFAAQNQQRPYPEDRPSETRAMVVYARPPASWDPTSGFAESALMKVRETDLLAEQLFGEELPFLLYNPSRASLDSWERIAVAHQASVMKFSRGEISYADHRANIAAASPGLVRFDGKRMRRFAQDIVWAPIGTQQVVSA
jgi:hypothetical protein